MYEDPKPYVSDDTRYSRDEYLSLPAAYRKAAVYYMPRDEPTIYINRDATIQLHDVLVSRGITRTLTEIDNAIDSAQVALSYVNGWEPVRQIEYRSMWWDEIIEDVCESLDLDYDEVEETAL